VFTARRCRRDVAARPPPPRSTSPACSTSSARICTDHAGGNVALPSATIVVQRREAGGARDAGIVASNYTPADFDTGQPRLEVTASTISSATAGICLPTFGHTPGHQSLLVRLDGGDVACRRRRYFGDAQELRLPLVVHDPVAMLASLQRLRALAAVGTRIVYGHDPESWATMPQAPVAIT
jgi:glyoxylase-like metal-dependent hydrolase (beta-lactamase superfamily II)